MRIEDMLKDILDYKIYNQIIHNESIINIHNPEARQMFKQLRDDEMRDIVKLQQKINRMTYSKSSVILKTLPAKPKH